MYVVLFVCEKIIENKLLSGFFVEMRLNIVVMEIKFEKCYDKKIF